MECDKQNMEREKYHPFLIVYCYFLFRKIKFS